MKKDRLVGLILAAAGILAAIGTGTIQISTQHVGGDPGPRLMPYFSAILLIICGIGIFFKNASSEETMTKEGWINCFSTIGICLVYVFALEPVGFLISSAVALMGLLCQITYAREGKEAIRPIPYAVFSVVVTLLLYLFFTRVLNIVLPKGLISF